MYIKKGDNVAKFIIPDSTKIPDPSLNAPLRTFFKKEKQMVIVPLDRIVLTRFSTISALNAQKRMLLAAKGLIPKRSPIDIKKLSDYFYEVIDGNSTSAVLFLNGYDSVHALIREE